MKRKAELLLNHLKKNNVSWNSKGEFRYYGDTISNSNILDLINDALRRRANFNPVDYKTFYKVLRETNVPRDLVGHRERWGELTRDDKLRHLPEFLKDINWDTY